jgi:hypothetical protein
MARIPSSVLYSLLLFSPVLLLLLLPVPCLGSECILLTAIQLAYPSQLEPGGLAGFCAWSLGPLLAATVIITLGLAGYHLTGKDCPRRIDWVGTWALFCLTALGVAWYAIILVTSIGASETPPEEFLALTALMALTVITLGQPLILLWLFLVNRIWKAHAQQQTAARSP